MAKELLTFLANEVQKGNRPNKSFKSSSFVAVANAISKKFKVKCLPEHIDNHLKTVKNAWTNNLILGGILKMITISPTVYNTYTEICNAVHHLRFSLSSMGYYLLMIYLNRKIDMYDEMTVVVGKDVAQESGAKSFDDVEIHSHGNAINFEKKGDGDHEFVKDSNKQSTSSAPLESRKSRKRTHDDELTRQNISTQIGEVTITLQKISKSKLDVNRLYQQVMKTKGFEEDFLGRAITRFANTINLMAEHNNKKEQQ
ncbi:hypothetical protein Cgig2_024211 [Carnegiea gigantea]|uniref:Myb/SANT-like domain-containing protein n=1 Tax=Carnegiea gigantea TaxID=171969 RepID=A0A9Q1JHN3_9CARY|nr:hypothetical protein Cgig2_024211 [Carnegiea gigantea]